MARLTLQTGPGVFEVLAHVCRSHQEAVKQFVENSADAIQQISTDEGRISVILEYQPTENEHQGRTLSRILVADNGIGMDREKMKSILQRIGDSEKVQMALRGEKGIGILAFSLVAEELHLASTVADGVPSSCVVLKRSWLKTGQAQIAGRCPRHTHCVRMNALTPQARVTAQRIPVCRSQTRDCVTLGNSNSNPASKSTRGPIRTTTKIKPMINATTNNSSG